jgi:hypothetical protein
MRLREKAPRSAVFFIECRRRVVHIACHRCVPDAARESYDRHKIRFLIRGVMYNFRSRERPLARVEGTTPPRAFVTHLPVSLAVDGHSIVSGSLTPELACVDGVGHALSQQNRRILEHRPALEPPTQASSRVIVATVRLRQQ